VIDTSTDTISARITGFSTPRSFGTWTRQTLVPNASYNSNKSSGIIPYTVQFTDLIIQNPTSLYCDFGDGSTSNDQNPVHIYTSEGLFNVSLNSSYIAGYSIHTKTGFIKALNHLANYTANQTSGAHPLTV
jgi:PKD repeat protein